MHMGRNKNCKSGQSTGWTMLLIAFRRKTIRMASSCVLSSMSCIPFSMASLCMHLIPSRTFSTMQHWPRLTEWQRTSTRHTVRAFVLAYPALTFFQPSRPHMGRHFIMTLITVVWEGRQSFGFLQCGILGPLSSLTPAPTPCPRKLFPRFSTLDLHMLVRCSLGARVSVSPLKIMGDRANQDSCQDNATVNHGQTNPKQTLR